LCIEETFKFQADIDESDPGLSECFTLIKSLTASDDQTSNFSFDIVFDPTSAEYKSLLSLREMFSGLQLNDFLIYSIFLENDKNVDNAVSELLSYCVLEDSSSSSSSDNYAYADSIFDQSNSNSYLNRLKFQLKEAQNLNKLKDRNFDLKINPSIQTENAIVTSMISSSSKSSSSSSGGGGSGNNIDDDTWKTVGSKKCNKINMKSSKEKKIQTHNDPSKKKLIELYKCIYSAHLLVAGQIILKNNPGIIVNYDEDTLEIDFFGFQSPNNTISEITIDLHYLYFKEASLFVKKVLEYYRNENIKYVNNKNQAINSVNFIVGKGSHSKSGRARLKPLLADFLSVRDYKCSIREGIIIVYI
jgi:hypothetical protein